MGLILKHKRQVKLTIDAPVLQEGLRFIGKNTVSYLKRFMETQFMATGDNVRSNVSKLCFSRADFVS